MQWVTIVSWSIFRDWRSFSWCNSWCMRKLKAPPKPTMPDNLEDAQLIINEQYHYILCLLDKFNTNSTNSSKPPSSDFNKNNRSKNNNERGNGTPKKKNKAGAQEGHKGSKRNLEPLKDTDTIVDCFADSVCSQCGESMIANKTPSYRHRCLSFRKPPFTLLNIVYSTATVLAVITKKKGNYQTTRRPTK